MKKALLYTKKLETAGLARDLAETHVGILEEILEDEMATKADLKQLQTNLTNEMRILNQQLLIRFGIMTVASTTFILSALSLIKSL